MIRVSLVGNPNTGKTTLYNCLTGADEHVGNWHGVTVEEKEKIYKYKNQNINLVDLPGIYSLTSLSLEEEVAIKYIYSHKDNIIVNICDASNLQRNLYLTLCLQEFGAKIILAINQIDKKAIYKIDVKKLQKMLNLPVVFINPSQNQGIDALNDAILNYKEEKTSNSYLKNIDIGSAKAFLNTQNDFFAIKLLENDKNFFNYHNININSWQENQVEQIASARYDFIDKVVASCTTKQNFVYGQSKLDKFLLNRFLAIPIFLCILAAVFYLTFFSFGKVLSDALVLFLDKCISAPLLNLISSWGAGEGVVSFFEVGLFGGASAVLGFLPQVALLFLFLSILEDSGYLARVAFASDDILSKVGLSGKSIYTLLMGFGCSTTAVLTSRNMENKNAKVKTALLTPYMSCSAKFPIYAVLGGAFFGANNIFVILGLYILGVVVAVLLSYIFEKSCLKSNNQSFILEFPPYHTMSFARLAKCLYKNIKEFVVRVGSIIISMNIIVWLLSNFSFTFAFVGNNGDSMLKTLGKVLSPIFAPLGFSSWGLISALVAGLVAKEVVLSSIYMFSGVLEGQQMSLIASLTTLGSAVYFSSKASVLSYLVFCLLYFPCLASISVLSKEIGKKWTFIGCVIEFVVAYCTSFVVYRFALFGAMGFVYAAIFAVILISILIVKNKLKGKGCSQCHKCNKKCHK